MCAAARDSALLTGQKMAYRRSYMVQASFAIAGGFDGVVAFSALLGVTGLEIVDQAKSGRAGEEEPGASDCGRCTKSAARIQKRSSRRSVTLVA